MLRLYITFCLLLAATSLVRAQGADTPANTPATVAPTELPAEIINFNLELATYGGKQFWTDQAILAGYRVQRNAVTGHCRLLDPEDTRLAWGSLEFCERELERLRIEKELQPPQGKVVIAMHGLLRSRHQLQEMCDYLHKEGGYEVVNFNYASSRAEVGEHAAALHRVLSKYTQAEEINFVAHSLGNIVLRHYLGDCASGAHGQKPDERIKRIVMLGPPNHGAEIAHRFSENKLFQVVWGKSGKQLAERWVTLEPKLATPSCEFGIIAGGRGTDIGLNPLVTGDDDGVVAVSETKLPGACDFLVCPVLHGDLMDDAEVRKCMLNFLRNGYFVSAEKRTPIPAATAQRDEP